MKFPRSTEPRSKNILLNIVELSLQIINQRFYR